MPTSAATKKSRPQKTLSKSQKLQSRARISPLKLLLLVGALVATGVGIKLLSHASRAEDIPKITAASVNANGMAHIAWTPVADTSVYAVNYRSLHGGGYGNATRNGVTTLDFQLPDGSKPICGDKYSITVSTYDNPRGTFVSDSGLMEAATCTNLTQPVVTERQSDFINSISFGARVPNAIPASFTVYRDGVTWKHVSDILGDTTFFGESASCGTHHSYSVVAHDGSGHTTPASPSQTMTASCQGSSSPPSEIASAVVASSADSLTIKLTYDHLMYGTIRDLTYMPGGATFAYNVVPDSADQVTVTDLACNTRFMIAGAVYAKGTTVAYAINPVIGKTSACPIVASTPSKGTTGTLPVTSRTVGQPGIVSGSHVVKLTSNGVEEVQVKADERATGITKTMPEDTTTRGLDGFNRAPKAAENDVPHKKSPGFLTRVLNFFSNLFR